MGSSRRPATNNPHRPGGLAGRPVRAVILTMNFSDTALVQVSALIICVAAVPGIAALLIQIRSLENRLDDLESLRLLDAAERGRQNNEIIDLRRGLAILIAQLRRSNMTPEWTLDAVPVAIEFSRQQNDTTRQVRLWQMIAAKFDLTEQSELWFEMGWADNERGETVGERARALVAYARRRGRLDELVALCREKRPDGGF